MSAETLRRAAAQIRNDHGGIISRTTLDGRRWLPVADFLDYAARYAEWIGRQHPDSVEADPVVGQAFNVARAYLGEAS